LSLALWPLALRLQTGADAKVVGHGTLKIDDKSVN
jgi:hypothetical protein